MTTSHLPDRGSPETPAAAQSNSPQVGRRFVIWAGSILSAVATLAAGVPIVGFIFSPLLGQQQDEWLDAGPVQGFRHGQTRLVDLTLSGALPWDGPTRRIAAYVRRQPDDSWIVMAVDCTHLGCPVRWFPQSGLFLCPCHGGVYHADGQRASGPPPRGLYQYEHKIDGGRLLVRAGHLPNVSDPGTAGQPPYQSSGSAPQPHG